MSGTGPIVEDTERKEATEQIYATETLRYGTSLATAANMKNDEAIPELAASEGRTVDPQKRGPLDGSTSGTIGGGGPESGGPTERPNAPDMPPVDPENAASGRRAPDPIGSTAEPDEIKPGPSDVQRR